MVPPGGSQLSKECQTSHSFSVAAEEAAEVATRAPETNGRIPTAPRDREGSSKSCIGPCVYFPPGTLIRRLTRGGNVQGVFMQRRLRRAADTRRWSHQQTKKRAAAIIVFDPIRQEGMHTKRQRRWSGRGGILRRRAFGGVDSSKGTVSPTPLWNEKSSPVHCLSWADCLTGSYARG